VDGWGIGDWLLRSLKSAPLNAFPLCLPQRLSQEIDLQACFAASFFICYQVIQASSSYPITNKKRLWISKALQINLL
jgi:hypothetical protein